MGQAVAFVLCPGHSGSTLLGHFLGAHARVLHVGEIVTPMRRGRPFRCRVCEGPACPVWGSALTEPFVRECLERFHREQHLPGAFAALARFAARRPDLRRALHRRLFDALPETDVVVDSSKTLGWVRWNARGRDPARVVFLHLVRDLRGVLASHLRRPEPDPPGRVCRALVRSSELILRYLATRPASDVLRIRYEELVARPEEIGAELCRFLGQDFDPAMLDYYRAPQHVIGGNPAPTREVRNFHGSRDPSLEFLDRTTPENQAWYRDAKPGFRADMRWQQELDDETLARFDAVAGAMNRRLGYEGSGRAKSTSA